MFCNFLVLILVFRTQDFMTGVPAIPGKHLSIELVSKMVCFLFLAAMFMVEMTIF